MVFVVVVPTKVIKFLLITTEAPSLFLLNCCCCTYKGNQIFANHNRLHLHLQQLIVVVVPTKVIKFLLITTLFSVLSHLTRLLLYLQR